MREILFRGKTKNGEWKIGDLIIEWYGETPYIHWFEYSSLALSREEKVIPETVGQFTGLTDKNGKKIFEGDIVKAIEREHDEDENPIVVIGKMIFDDCCFGLKAKKVFDFYAPIWDENIELEVIGNVYDNPELLKGE